MGRSKKKKKATIFTSGTVPVLCYLGLENIHALTNMSTKYEVRFDLGLGSERAYAIYDDFKVGSAKQKFKLTIGNYRGNAGKEDKCCQKINTYQPLLMSDVNYKLHYFLITSFCHRRCYDLPPGQTFHYFRFRQ